ncbi:chemotaxis protein CheD [Rhodobacter ferrooxidans]|uniref:Probable chemoreceptor glutamine deamidase CheD n=1 Tax=Rhodobacter ferrooxidans TaxID=371731 RepID=C8S4D8_9RHOB|nr:chemotaxis protein CheD [Rhodobacter sp. SW2]EEW24197.1 CheD [Rhodobacter sp. SW2]
MNLQADQTTAVVQGEYRISEDPSEVLSTILGSCVAVCLHDPVRKVGGMNHFLLPFGQEEGTNRPVRYGLFAMEMLINALMKQGAKKTRLQAKLFGGARISADLRDIGKSNASFALEFLATEGIPCLGESLGGTNARRVIYRPTSGLARMLIVPSTNLAPVERQLPLNRPARQNMIELF